MTERLKALITQRGYDPEKIRALINLFDGNERWVEQLLAGRAKSHDDAHLIARYKATASTAYNPSTDWYAAACGSDQARRQ